ncbi:MAG TPA: branched-chain amino acid ABC transporter permease [Mycobacteriales bacterium]|jgi:branched-chain amino acid transport system permease protein|nr:branched-chain amino acid ABC transporter permease [Mycobacteriales bacterium]
MTAVTTPVPDAQPTSALTGRPSGLTSRVRRDLVVGAVVVLVLAAVPFSAPPEIVNALSRILALALLAVSLDLLVGVAGLPSLGHAAPFGIGAYAAGITAKELTTVAPVQLLVAVLAGAGMSAAVGWLVVRSRGTYLLMLTLAVAELFHVLAGRWQDVTGGTNGLVGIPAITLWPGGDPVRLAGYRYWYVLAVAVVGFALVVVVSRSAFGRSLRGIRDNEVRMSSLGYSAFRLKYTVFVLAGAVAGAAGSLWAAQARFVSPTDLGFEVSALALLAVVIGGRGSLWGAVLGTALVFYVRDEIGPLLGGRGQLLLGLVFIAAVFLLPRGFAGLRLPRRRPAGASS